MVINLKRALATSAVLAAIIPAPAHATEGYFLNGTSIRDKGMAGAGIAAPGDPLIIANNPAGLTEVGNQLTLGLSLFMPRRQFTGSGGPGFTPSGTVKSGSDYFFLPSAGWSRQIDDQSAVGIAVYGNGGLNTHYPAVANPACVSPPLPAPNGVFCGGEAGVNLIQAFVSAGYARKFGDHVSVGIAPLMAIQIFHAEGLAAFSYDPFGNPLTVDPSALTNNGNDTSTGFGVRAGILVKLTPQLRLAGSYQTKINMTKFSKYAGLFEDHGNFDIPSTYQIGLAFDPAPGFTIAADYRHVNYRDVPAVSNSSTIPQQFGSKGGPGFGWRNVNAFKIGVEGRVSERLTLRAGAAFNNNPVRGQDATINILAPGVIKQHFTLGARLGLAPASALDFSFVYAPTAHTRGIEITPAGPNPGHTIDLAMHQFEIGLGWSKRF